jgi:hypothetical protein
MKRLLFLIPVLLAGCGSLRECIDTPLFYHSIPAVTVNPAEPLGPPAPTVADLQAEIKADANSFLRIGLTTSELYQFFGPDPAQINVTVTATGRSEQWCFRVIPLYVYLQDGKVTAWQMLDSF